MDFNSYSRQSSGSSWDSNPMTKSDQIYFEGPRSKGDVMEEFRMNGIDTPFDPDDNLLYGKTESWMGLSSGHLRQRSWPAPESISLQQPPRPEYGYPTKSQPLSSGASWNALTDEQLRVLHSLPRTVVKQLLKVLNKGQYPTHERKARERGCAFCRSNGECAAWYESHVLRVGGRVCCPVLSGFKCRRCGATGDNAHTINYCPLATDSERQYSAAIIRSIRDASSRRRAQRVAASLDSQQLPPPPPPPRAPRAAHCPHYNSFLNTPLNEDWAAVERKLSAVN